MQICGDDVETQIQISLYLHPLLAWKDVSKVLPPPYLHSTHYSSNMKLFYGITSWSLMRIMTHVRIVK